MQMREMLAQAVVKYEERARQEAERPYDGWGETPQVTASWWRNQARSAQRMIDTLDARQSQ